MSALPLDLIREIIKFSVEDSLSRAASLATISRDFNDCVRPILARSLMLYDGDPEKQWPVPCHELSPWLEVNGKYVRNLIWGNGVEDLANVFRHCPNLTNLTIWVNVEEHDIFPLLPYLSTLHLSRISLNLYALFGNRNFSVKEGRHPAFRRATHLEVVHDFTQWNEIDGIASMPCLTHLSVNSTTLKFPELLTRILQECKQLKVLIAVDETSLLEESPFRVMDDTQISLGGELRDEPRLIALECECLAGWVHGATGREDVWEFGDKIVTQRLKDRKACGDMST